MKSSPLLWLALLGAGAYGAYKLWERKKSTLVPGGVAVPPARVDPGTGFPPFIEAPLSQSPAVPFSGIPGSVGPFSDVVRTSTPIWFAANEDLPVHSDPSINASVIGHINPKNWVAYVPTSSSNDVETYNGMLLVYGWTGPADAKVRPPIEGWVQASKLTRV